MIGVVATPLRDRKGTKTVPTAQPVFKFTYEDYRIHRLHGRALVVAQTLHRGQTLRSPLLPGFALALEDVFSS